MTGLGGLLSCGLVVYILAKFDRVRVCEMWPFAVGQAGGAGMGLWGELGRLVSARRTAPRREQKADLPPSQGASHTYSFL